MLLWGKDLHFYFLFIIFFNSCTYAQKIVVTGGAGFIGSHVAIALLNRGDSVVIIDNCNDAYSLVIKQKNLEFVIKNDIFNRLMIYYADVCDEDKMKAIFEQERPDVICHLAARAGVRQSIKSPCEYLNNNITGTCVMLEMAREFAIKHVVCASSSSVYGDRNGDEAPFCEEDAVNTQSSPYGMTKRSGELLGYVYHHLFGLSITNLRFFTVYGPRGRIDMAPFIFMHAINQGKELIVYGDGSAIRDFTYVGDIVDGVIKAIDIPLGYEIINLGRGEPQLLGHFIKTIESIVGKLAKITYADGFSGDVPRTYANISKAQQLLGYAPKVSIQEGMQAMYEWYKNEIDLSLYTKKYTKKSFFIEEW